MTQVKSKNYEPAIRFTKLTAFTVAVLSGLLCWMFSVSTTVSLLSINPTYVNTSGLQLAINISDYLANLSILFFTVGLVLAILGLHKRNKTDKKSTNKTVSLVIFVSILVILTVFRDNILQRLINSIG